MIYNETHLDSVVNSITPYSQNSTNYTSPSIYTFSLQHYTQSDGGPGSDEMFIGQFS